MEDMNDRTRAGIRPAPRTPHSTHNAPRGASSPPPTASTRVPPPTQITASHRVLT
ncbi:hypothetical protein K466DRAFT_589981 [Polyporus arcularius HHB13444]|uniref:Uncharacterized protein n=1 Tax=Polyporus arcularius HHB13444 TaxID=1314778 RepID=A0A5C3P1G1_9APHY|nr:hypothetical protein K466DRAFT_589981 [Polyporus arcularius HHB13444]